MELLTHSVLLDGLLAAALLGLGWAALATRDARRAVMLFIAFGLLLALVWVRLAAPDVALAEAAIGAGLSGVLLLAALRDEPSRDSAPSPRPARTPVATAVIDLLVVAMAGAMGLAYVHALTGLRSDALPDLVASHLPESGVSNPVTAVLLNFRAWDTLLELAVLLAAVLGILALGPARPPYRAAEPVLAGLVRWLVPLLVLTGGYLLWAGAHAPGGAFQAGAILAGAGVILRLAGHSGAGLPQGWALRAVAVGGVAVFLAVGLALLAAGRPFLDYPAAWAGTLILAIEAAATLAIAAALVLAFVGGRPARWQEEQP